MVTIFRWKETIHSCPQGTDAVLATRLQETVVFMNASLLAPPPQNKLKIYKYD